MSHTRRDFIKRMAATGILFAVGPVAGYIPKQHKVTFDALETKFQELCWGNHAPTLIVMNRKNWIQGREMLLSQSRWHFSNPKREVSNYTYNGADVVWNDDVPEGIVWFINEQCLDPRMSGMLELPEDV